MATQLLQSVSRVLGEMNPLDWVIAITLAVSTVTAFLRGLIRSLVSLAGVLAGALLAAIYAGRLGHYLTRWLTPRAFAQAVAFMLILAATYACAALLGRLLRGACSAVGLGFLDRLGGALFGFARGFLLLAALLLPLAPFLSYLRPARSSVLLPYLLPAAHGISFVMPREFGRRLPLGALTRDLRTAPEWSRATPATQGEHE